jgi:hypothetical protein
MLGKRYGMKCPTIGNLLRIGELIGNITNNLWALNGNMKESSRIHLGTPNSQKISPPLPSPLPFSPKEKNRGLLGACCLTSIDWKGFLLVICFGHYFGCMVMGGA